MPTIDERLLEPNGEPEFTENFNRILALIDKNAAAITALDERVEALETPT